MSYINTLRTYIGHRPAILVGAAVMIINEHAQVLLHHRTDDHMWDIPGGYMEIGETIEQTAKREVKEETGLEIGTLHLQQILSGPDLLYTYPNGDQVYPVVLIYLTHEYAGKIHPDGVEGDDARFFDMDALPKNLYPTLRKVFETYQKKLV